MEDRPCPPDLSGPNPNRRSRASIVHMALEKWKFDTVHSSVSFSVRHLMISRVHGSFKNWSGSLETDDADPSNSKVQISIDVASIDTKEPQRDEHLRSADFFDAANHGNIKFESTSVQYVDSEHFKVSGNLTIRGVSKPVTLDAEYFDARKTRGAASAPASRPRPRLTAEISAWCSTFRSRAAALWWARKWTLRSTFRQ